MIDLRILLVLGVLILGVGLLALWTKVAMDRRLRGHTREERT